MSSSQKVQSVNLDEGTINMAKQQQRVQLIQQSFGDADKNLSQSYIRQQGKSQNPKIGRPAKTDQQEQFKKYYLQNKQKFELECQLLVFIHQNYFDQIIDNPINARVNKQYMDRLFVANQCDSIYRTLLKLNQNYFKNSSYYPEQKLKYTSLLDVAYMCNAIKQQHGDKLTPIQLLLIIFFYLYNQKLVNQDFYQYFTKNLQKFRQGMIFGPGGKNGPKLEKLDKLIICLALTLAQLQKILIEEVVQYSDQQYSQSSQQEQHYIDEIIKLVQIMKEMDHDQKKEYMRIIEKESIIINTQLKIRYQQVKTQFEEKIFFIQKVSNDLLFFLIKNNENFLILIRNIDQQKFILFQKQILSQTYSFNQIQIVNKAFQIEFQLDQNNIIPMLVLKRQEFIDKAFQNLFLATGRIMFQINQLIQMLKIQPNSVQILSNIWDGLKQRNSIIVFKFLILMNKIIMDFVIEPAIISSLLEKIDCQQINEFDQLLNKKLIKPYKLYLMKRCQFLPKKSQNLDKMYQLMNLIQSATSFSEIIYTLGRYYSKTYPFAADFNIVLGNDLNTVYNQMIKYTPKPAPSDILQQYQKIHQKLYIIYYNCYFYKYLKPFVPRWVVTDITSTEQKTFQKSPNSNKSLGDTMASSSLKKLSQKKINISSFSQFDLSKSLIILNPHQKQKKVQQSLMLLKSMERVFQQLEDI